MMTLLGVPESFLEVPTSTVGVFPLRPLAEFTQEKKRGPSTQTPESETPSA